METLEPLSEGIHTELETHQRERSELATTAGGRPKQEHSYYAERDAIKGGAERTVHEKSKAQVSQSFVLAF